VTSDYADGGVPTPTRNLRRLRKHTVESKAAAAKEHAIDVAAEVKESESEGLLSYKR
jgi:chromodomain-helicase-DNA-binding protein 4